MTIRVRVENTEGEGGRVVEVESLEGTEAPAVVERVRVEPGKSADFWIHGTRTLNVKEVPT